SRISSLWAGRCLGGARDERRCPRTVRRLRRRCQVASPSLLREGARRHAMADHVDRALVGSGPRGHPHSWTEAAMTAPLTPKAIQELRDMERRLLGERPRAMAVAVAPDQDRRPPWLRGPAGPRG